ncbi:MAG: diacylglycerol kinase [Candidatus Kuenenia sp.]|nr:diacylglycerol kinase [Candidatus Kuenenia hertensis]
MKRLWMALAYSLCGLKDTFNAERAFRQEVIATCILLPLALYIPVPLYLKLLLIVCNIIVLIVELLNSSLELIADIVSPEFNVKVKRAKDCGSAAVFLSLASWFIVWMVAFSKLLYPI